MRAGWEQHPDGRKLKEEGDNFRAKINTAALFEDWVAKVGEEQFPATSVVFCLQSKRGVCVCHGRLSVSPFACTQDACPSPLP